MTSQFLAVRLGLLSLLSSYLPGIPEHCPALSTVPTARLDQNPQALMQLMNSEVQGMDEAEGAQVIFYGDSILESWRGTDMGQYALHHAPGTSTDRVLYHDVSTSQRPSERSREGPTVFSQSFGKYRSLIMAVGGDQVENLQWRISNGNIPEKHHPDVVVVNIGINDILVGNSCYPMEALGNITALRVMDLVDTMLDLLPETHIMLVSILPAGDTLHPESLFQWPNDLTQGITLANSWVAKAFSGEERVTVVDCNHKFVPFGWIERILQPDGVHPTHYGLKVLADCISAPVDSYMSHLQRHSNSRHPDRRLHLNLTRQHLSN